MEADGSCEKFWVWEDPNSECLSHMAAFCSCRFEQKDANWKDCFWTPVSSGSRSPDVGCTRWRSRTVLPHIKTPPDGGRFRTSSGSFLLVSFSNCENGPTSSWSHSGPHHVSQSGTCHLVYCVSYLNISNHDHRPSSNSDLLHIFT